MINTEQSWEIRRRLQWGMLAVGLILLTSGSAVVAGEAATGQSSVAAIRHFPRQPCSSKPAGWDHVPSSLSQVLGRLPVYVIFERVPGKRILYVHPTGKGRWRRIRLSLKQQRDLRHLLSGRRPVRLPPGILAPFFVQRLPAYYLE